MNQKPIMIFMILVILFLGLALGYMIVTKEVVQAPAPVVIPAPIATPTTSVNNETANWKVYNNDEYRLEFKYPNYFSDLENLFSPQNEVALGTSNLNFVSDIVKSFNFYICSSDRCGDFDTIKENLERKNYSNLSIKIGDQISSIFINNDSQHCNVKDNKTCYHIEAFFEKDKKIYKFEFWGSGNENLNNINDTVIKKILSTFKFTK